MSAHDLKRPDDAALALALAMVTSSASPLLLLDGALNIIAASKSFCRAFAIDPTSVPGRRISELGDGEWDVPQLKSLLNATAAGHAHIEAYEIDLVRKGQDPRRLVLNAQKLEYGEGHDVRLIVTVSDVTDARLAEKIKDDLIREKAILLQELQHRVANSLQIIASVLLQSARRVNSDETRTHLYDAHNRVMSVAVLQQQLAASTLGDVALRAYFTDLCKSLGASMIANHDQLSLEVRADESVTTANVSVSLGLIITELVINALKHAFPGHRQGHILVGYQSDGPDWTLTVEDNGVGMPQASSSAKSGLGTSIVEALANQLHARVHNTPADPGTLVSVVHTQA
jgi:two-component sensor histidine kinase